MCGNDQTRNSDRWMWRHQNTGLLMHDLWQRKVWQLAAICSTAHLHKWLLGCDILAQEGCLLAAALQRWGSQEMSQCCTCLVHFFQRNCLLSYSVLDMIFGKGPATILKHLIRLFVATKRVPTLTGLWVPMTGQNDVECVLAMQWLWLR